MNKSNHQLRVEEFMKKIPTQKVPDKPLDSLNSYEAIQRAKLIFEECMETISALGVTIGLRLKEENSIIRPLQLFDFHYLFDANAFNLIEVIDGCCDISVVTTGTMIALGLPMEPFLEEVDVNNLQKFGEGHSFNAFGKLVKPPWHKPPRIQEVLDRIKNTNPMYTKTQEFISDSLV